MDEQQLSIFHPICDAAGVTLNYLPSGRMTKARDIITGTTTHTLDIMPDLPLDFKITAFFAGTSESKQEAWVMFKTLGSLFMLLAYKRNSDTLTCYFGDTGGTATFTDLGFKYQGLALEKLMPALKKTIVAIYRRKYKDSVTPWERVIDSSVDKRQVQHDQQVCAESQPTPGATV